MFEQKEIEFFQKAAKERTKSMDRDQFIAALRTALMQLDDLQSLRANPLLAHIAIQGQPATPAYLQRVLLDAIDALQSDPEVPLALAYDILYYRYVEQMGQSEVAYQIGVSVRQLRRYQNNALEYLADRLQERYFVGISIGKVESPQQASIEQIENPPLLDSTSGNAAFDKEIACLRQSFHCQVSSIDTELTKALQEVKVLTCRFAVEVQPDISGPDLTTAIPPTVLRQTLITMLTTAITRSAQMSLSFRIAALESRRKVEFVLMQTTQTEMTSELTAYEPLMLDEEFWASMHTTSQLLQPFAGQVQVDSTVPLCIRLTAPVVTGVPILVVDDNEDVRYLFRRYAAHSRFHIMDTGDTAEVLPLMKQYRVAAIVMDIMMPGIDGWEMLAKLRHHPLTAGVPILICTILPQKDLSQHLGATAFIQKPVSQQTFLSALDRLLALSSQGPSA